MLELKVRFSSNVDLPLFSSILMFIDCGTTSSLCVM